MVYWWRVGLPEKKLRICGINSMALQMTRDASATDYSYITTNITQCVYPYTGDKPHVGAGYAEFDVLLISVHDVKLTPFRNTTNFGLK